MKKLMLTAVASVASLGLIAGCGNGGTTSESTDSPAPETTATEETTDESTDEEAAAGDGGELVVWVDENRQPAVEAAAASFEEETGATVNLIVKNFEDIRADFLAQVPTGEGPDITVGAHDWLGAFVNDGVVNTVDLGATSSDFESVSLEAFTYDGQLYGMPYALEAIALIQNTEMVGDTAPATWDEMMTMAEESGASRPFVVNVNGETGDGYHLYGFQTSFGAPVFEQEDDGSYTNTVGMGGENGQAFAQWLGENGEAGTGAFSTTVDYDIANELFATGEAPFIVAGPWAIATLTEQGVDVAVNPIPNAGPQDAQPFVGVQGFYVSAQSNNALLANEFLTNYLATPEAQQALHDADPRIPAHTSVEAGDPLTEGFQASAQNGVPMPSIPEMGSVWDFWNAAEAQIIKGEDPVATWDKMVSDLEAAIQ